MFLGFQGLQVHVSNVFFCWNFQAHHFVWRYLFQVQRSLFVPSLNVNFASWLHHLEFHCFQMNFLYFVFKLFRFQVLSFFFICSQVVFLLLLCASIIKFYYQSSCVHLQLGVIVFPFAWICNQVWFLLFLCAFVIKYCWCFYVHLQSILILCVYN